MYSIVYLLCFVKVGLWIVKMGFMHMLCTLGVGGGWGGVGICGFD